MNRVVTFVIAVLLATAAGAAEYMEKTSFQLSRTFSPGVVTSGGLLFGSPARPRRRIVGINIANNFEAQVKQVSLRLTAF